MQERMIHNQALDRQKHEYVKARNNESMIYNSALHRQKREEAMQETMNRK